MQTPTPDQKRVGISLVTADRDMAAAELLAKEGAPQYETTGFHCQQASEKYLKAALVISGLPVLFTHDLVKPILPLQQLGSISFTAQDLADAATLNEFAVEFRYETDDAPSFTSADLLTMADRFRTKLRPLAQAFLT
jgi:HEPN domain-containing protein